MSHVLQATIQAVQDKIPDLSTAQLGPEYAYQSLPLCIIDSVFSIGVRYSNAQNAVEAWCRSHEPAWQKFRLDNEQRRTINEFLRLTDGLDGATLSARFFGGNRQRTSTRGGILKSEAVVRYAKALLRAGIDDFADVREPHKTDTARHEISAIPGHASGISFDYFLMLAGDDTFVKADRMICRFVCTAAGIHVIKAEEARAIVIGACGELVSRYPNLTPRLLDYLIWCYQRQQTLAPVRQSK